MPSVYPLKSKKKLFAFLSDYFDAPIWAEQGLKHPNVSNETYGRDSCIYLRFDNSSTYEKVKAALVRHGFKVNSYKGKNAIEVSVSYFKGHHWDE